MKFLIIPANMKMESFENILHVYSDCYGNFESILLLDSKETDENINRNIRSALIREIFGGEIEIREKKLYQNIHLLLPDILVKCLKQFSKNEIVVDLTNGTKEISSVLYMAASLSKIENIIYVTVKSDKDNNFVKLKEISENKKQYYIVKKFEPIQDIVTLGKNNYFDLLFYQDMMNAILESFSEKYQNDIIGWKLNIINGLENYFSGKKKYRNAIQNFGLFLEGYSALVLNKLKQFPEYKDSKSLTDVFSKYFDEIRKNHQKRNFFNDERDYNFSTDTLFKIAREYRNAASHENPLEFDELDVQICILITFLILRKTNQLFTYIDKG